MGYYDFYERRPYVSAAKRRAQAAKKLAKLRKSGRVISPVETEGRKIARTFWGESWCQNLEAYSDYSNRLPRGRTYVRNGSVLDLQIEAGRVRALVNGTSFYDVDIEIKRLAAKRWKGIKSQCAGKIDSMVELLQGSISKGVMEIVTRKGEGLFPAPREISLSCSCPDWATMCKHVAAALYGVGARIDQQPEMLFTLRGVEPAEMIAAAVTDFPTRRKNGGGRILESDDMASVFGIDLDMGTLPESEAAPRAAPRRKKTASKRKTKPRSTAAVKKTAPKRKSPQKKAASNTTTKAKTTPKRAKVKPARVKKVAASSPKAKKATKAKKTTKKRSARKKVASVAAGAKTPRRHKTAAKKTRQASKKTGR